MLASGFQHRILPIQADKKTGMVLVDRKWFLAQNSAGTSRQAAAPPHLESSTQLRTHRHVLIGATERSSLYVCDIFVIRIFRVFSMCPPPARLFSAQKKRGEEKFFLLESSFSWLRSDFPFGTENKEPNSINQYMLT